MASIVDFYSDINKNILDIDFSETGIFFWRTYWRASNNDETFSK